MKKKTVATPAVEEADVQVEIIEKPVKKPRKPRAKNPQKKVVTMKPSEIKYSDLTHMVLDHVATYPAERMCDTAEFLHLDTTPIGVFNDLKAAGLVVEHQTHYFVTDEGKQWLADNPRQYKVYHVHKHGMSVNLVYDPVQDEAENF